MFWYLCEKAVQHLSRASFQRWLLILLVITQFVGCGGTQSNVLDTEHLRSPAKDDQAALAKIALKSRNPEARAEAVHRLTDQQKLHEVAMRSRHLYTCQRAVNRITSQPLLTSIAVERQTDLCRNSAVKRVTDQVVLTEMATRDADKLIRISAIGNLHDQGVLIRIISDPQLKDRDILLAAIKNITDQATLWKIINDPEFNDRYIHLRGIRNVTGPEFNHRDIHLTAVRNITDQTILSKIINDPRQDDPVILLAAIENTTDQATLSDILLGKGRWAEVTLDNVKIADHNARLSAAIKNTTDQQTLAQILRGKGQWGTTTVPMLNAVILKTTDPEILTEVAQGQGFWSFVQDREFWLEEKMISIRIETTLRLSDQSVLSALALDGNNVYVRKAATTRLTDTNSLLSVIKKYPIFKNSQLGGLRSYPTFQASLAKIVLFLNDPVIRSHAPGLETEFKISTSTQKYNYIGDSNDRTVKGEKIRLTVRQTENVVGSWQWKTDFPPALFTAKPFLIAAHIDLDEFLSKIDSALGLTDEERAVLAKESPVEEVRDFFRKYDDQ